MINIQWNNKPYFLGGLAMTVLMTLALWLRRPDYPLAITLMGGFGFGWGSVCAFFWLGEWRIRRQLLQEAIEPIPAGSSPGANRQPVLLHRVKQ